MRQLGYSTGVVAVAVLAVATRRRDSHSTPAE
jgi:hypothetical protein